VKHFARWSVLLALVGCKANGLVVVTVDAAPAIDNVSTLAGTASAGGRTVSFTVTPSGGGNVSIPPEQTFGIDVPTSISGPISVHLDARNASGDVLASGDGSGVISVGKRSDIAVTLGNSPLDMAMVDDAGVDMLAPVLTITPATFDFGAINKNGTGIMKAFTVKNVGNADLAALPAASVVGGPSSSFIVITDGCNQQTLSVGASCTVTLQFTPKVAGVLNASLSVSGATAAVVGTSFGAFTADVPAGDLLGYVFMGVWGSSANDVYIAGNVSGSTGVVFHRDGAGTWTTPTLPSNPPKLVAVWGSSGNDVYAIGGSAGASGALVLRSTGNGTFTQSFYYSQAQANDIWGSAANDLYLAWAGGTAPAAAHYGVWHSTDGNNWTAQTTAPDIQQAVWGPSGSDVYVVGGGILHSAGNGAWSSQNGTPNLKAVWGSSATDIYAVGAAGVILHSKGDGTWQMQTAPVNDFYGVWGSGPTDIWVVGTNGIVLRSAGDGSWSQPVLSNTSIQLNGIWGSSSGDFWIVGNNNVILHYH
jgi:hypothetical protein